MGHGATDVTSLYEWHEVEKFLEEDRARLQFYVTGNTDRDGIKLVTGA